MEIPVPHINRTVGTQRESSSREWRDRYKRGRRMVGKTAMQAEGVKWTEKRVGKTVSQLSRKAAMDLYAPVP